MGLMIFDFVRVDLNVASWGGSCDLFVFVMLLRVTVVSKGQICAAVLCRWRRIRILCEVDEKVMGEAR